MTHVKTPETMTPRQKTEPSVEAAPKEIPTQNLLDQDIQSVL